MRKNKKTVEASSTQTISLHSGDVIAVAPIVPNAPPKDELTLAREKVLELENAKKNELIEALQHAYALYENLKNNAVHVDVHLMIQNAGFDLAAPTADETSAPISSPMEKSKRGKASTKNATGKSNQDLIMDAVGKTPLKSVEISDAVYNKTGYRIPNGSLNPTITTLVKKGTLKKDSDKKYSKA